MRASAMVCNTKHTHTLSSVVDGLARTDLSNLNHSYTMANKQKRNTMLTMKRTTQLPHFAWRPHTAIINPIQETCDSHNSYVEHMRFSHFVAIPTLRFIISTEGTCDSNTSHGGYMSLQARECTSLRATLTRTCRMVSFCDSTFPNARRVLARWMIDASANSAALYTPACARVIHYCLDMCVTDCAKCDTLPLILAPSPMWIVCRYAVRS